MTVCPAKKGVSPSTDAVESTQARLGDQIEFDTLSCDYDSARSSAHFCVTRSPIAVATARKVSDSKLELGEIQLSAGTPGLVAKLQRGGQDVELKSG